MNSRVVRTHGYTPAELILGFQPKYLPTEETYEAEIRGEIVTAGAEEWVREGATVQELAWRLRFDPQEVLGDADRVVARTRDDFWSLMNTVNRIV